MSFSSMVSYFFAIVVGIITGIITSLIGASGVMVIVPALTMLFHVNTHAAIGTSLFVDVIASLTVSYNYFKNGNVDLRAGAWIAVSSIVGAQLGAMFASQINEGFLSSLFGIFLLISGIMMLGRSGKKEGDTEKEAEKRTLRFKKRWQQIVLAVIVGIGIGIISGIFGAGGGVMILLALIIIMSYPLHKAIGTSTLIMSMTALSSTIGYAVRGNINLILGCFLAIGAVAGGTVGSFYANKVNEKTLQKIVSAVFICLGGMMTLLEII